MSQIRDIREHDLKVGPGTKSIRETSMELETKQGPETNREGLESQIRDTQEQGPKEGT